MTSEHISIVTARRIADEFARERGLVLVGPVLDGEAEPERCNVPIYLKPPDYPASWYVVLAIDEHADVLRSSRVIGVSKRTGEAHLLGDAGDEG
jgi:hypothetical protein